jgi:hypothetical protein
MNPFEQIVRSEGELREIVGTPGARAGEGSARAASRSMTKKDVAEGNAKRLY